MQIQPIDSTMTLVVPNDFYDLERTLFCGQAFRWHRTENPTAFKGIHKNYPIMVAQERPGGPIYLTAGLEEVKRVWVPYFGFDDTYDADIQSLDLDPFAQYCFNQSKGIHILRQDLWEMIISYIISQRNRLNNIGATVERLSSCIPSNRTQFGQYSFPTPHDLKYVLDTVPADSLRLGYRLPYIQNVVQYFSQHPDKLAWLSNATTSEAYNYLLSFSGIGPKVANCILLFGMHRTERFPVDIWIQRVIDTYYAGQLDHTRYGNYAGVIQQYMFNCIRNQGIDNHSELFSQVGK